MWKTLVEPRPLVDVLPSSQLANASHTTSLQTAPTQDKCVWGRMAAMPENTVQEGFLTIC